MHSPAPQARGRQAPAGKLNLLPANPNSPAASMLLIRNVTAGNLLLQPVFPVAAAALLQGGGVFFRVTADFSPF